MKNIHILPTDKPSRLYEGNLGKPVTIQSASAQLKKPLNIYITSDEEIKEGDWFISLYSNSIQRELKLDWTLNKDAYKKIILTTDQDLIKDGVQAIDDEFLKWICKNPSCEEVEVIKEDWILNPDVDYFYKIIIPRTTQQIIDEDFAGGLDMGQILPKEELSTKLHKGEILDESYPKEFKQETLEEVAEKYANDWEEIHPKLDFEDMTPIAISKIDFIEGAKWQQERSYSEEDLKYAFEQGKYYDMTSFEEWFEQFKKK